MKFLPSLSLLLAVLVAGQTTTADAADRRALTPADFARIADVGDPQLSPDGRWVAYTVSSSDLKKDEISNDLWMSDWQTGKSTRLTSTPEDESSPRWSADGKTLGFLSSRGIENEAAQLWLLPMGGGEAERVTDLKGAVEDYAFAPDGKRVALIVSDEDPSASADEDQTAPPIVIDRFYFKEDETGYLGAQRSHVYLLDLATRQVTALTPGNYDEMLPSWSPDGRQIAFVSKRTGDPDRNDTFGVYVIEARAGAEPRRVTEYEGEGADTEWASAPQWSPDGRQLALVAGNDPKLTYYSGYGIATVPAAGGTPKWLTRDLDRNTFQPRWSTDGRTLTFLIEHDRNQQLARVPAAGGKVTYLSQGRRTVAGYTMARGGRIALLQSSVDRPYEVYALDGAQAQQLSHHNDALLAEVQLASVEEFSADSKDGTRISGFLVKPPGYVAGQKYPTLLRIHGGPVSQFANEFKFEWQLFAANG